MSSTPTYWRLHTKAAVRGVDFEVAFELPVFATGETVVVPEAGQPLLAEYREDVATPKALAVGGVTFLPVGSGGHPAFAFSTQVQPAEGEPFAVRKIRYQLERVRKHPGASMEERNAGRLIANLRAQPRLQVTVTSNVPGPALAQTVGRLLEQRIGIKAAASGGQ